MAESGCGYKHFPVSVLRLPMHFPKDYQTKSKSQCRESTVFAEDLPDIQRLRRCFCRVFDSIVKSHPRAYYGIIRYVLSAPFALRIVPNIPVLFRAHYFADRL